MKGVGLWTLFLVYFYGLTEVKLDRVDSSSLSSSSLVKKLTAVCGKDGIKVMVKFYRPFTGIAYSDGHYDTPKCVFINAENENAEVPYNETRFSFLIPADACGTVFHDPATTLTALQGNEDEDETMLPSDGTALKESSIKANEVYMQNTVMFQKNHFIQEQGDLAQTLRCVWQKEIRRPLHATLPLMGKQPKHPVRRHNKTQNHYRLHHHHHPQHYIPFSYHSTTQEASNTGAKKRFQPKGQVETVSFGRRQGKAIDMTRFPEIASPHDGSISFRSLYNLTALPFKDPRNSGGGSSRLPLASLLFNNVILAILCAILSQ